MRHYECEREACKVAHESEKSDNGSPSSARRKRSRLVRTEKAIANRFEMRRKKESERERKRANKKKEMRKDEI